MILIFIFSLELIQNLSLTEYFHISPGNCVLFIYKWSDITPCCLIVRNYMISFPELFGLFLLQFSYFCDMLWIQIYRILVVLIANKNRRHCFIPSCCDLYIFQNLWFSHRYSSLYFKISETSHSNTEHILANTSTLISATSFLMYRLSCVLCISARWANLFLLSPFSFNFSSKQIIILPCFIIITHK